MTPQANMAAPTPLRKTKTDSSQRCAVPFCRLPAPRLKTRPGAAFVAGAVLWSLACRFRGRRSTLELGVQISWQAQYFGAWCADFVAGAVLWSLACRFRGRRSALELGADFVAGAVLWSLACRFRGRHSPLELGVQISWQAQHFGAWQLKHFRPSEVKGY